jgi:hypothetical protein
VPRHDATTLSAARVAPPKILLPKTRPPAPATAGARPAFQDVSARKLSEPSLSARERSPETSPRAEPQENNMEAFFNFLQIAGPRKRRRSSFARNGRTAFAALALRAPANRGDAEASPARHDEEENDENEHCARAPALRALANDSDAEASPASHDEEENDENQHATPRRDVALLEGIALGAEKPPEGTPATPVTQHFRRRAIIASDVGVERIRGGGDLFPQVAEMMNDEEIAKFQNEENDAGGDTAASEEKTLKIKLHRLVRRACELVFADYTRRKAEVAAKSFGHVFPAWVPCGAQVKTPRLREIAADHAAEGRDDSIEGAVCAVQDVIGEIMDHGNFLPDGWSVDKVMNASVVDPTIFAADGETHYCQGHVLRAGVSTGETNAHQDHSIAGVTMAFAFVPLGEDPSGVAHEFQWVDHTYSQFREGAFQRGGGNGSSIEKRARPGAVTLVKTHGNTKPGGVRVMSITPFENAVAMHRVANPKRAARVVIQLVIDSGLGLAWAERVATYIRRFLGQKLMNPTVTVREVTAPVLALLSKEPNTCVSAEVPTKAREAAEAEAAAKQERAAAAAAKAAAAAEEESLALAVARVEADCAEVAAAAALKATAKWEELAAAKAAAKERERAAVEAENAALKAARVEADCAEAAAAAEERAAAKRGLAAEAAAAAAAWVATMERERAAKKEELAAAAAARDADKRAKAAEKAAVAAAKKKEELAAAAAERDADKRAKAAEKAAVAAAKKKEELAAAAAELAAAAAERGAAKRAKAALRAARVEAHRTEAAAAVNPILQWNTHVASAVAAAAAAWVATMERERAAKKEELAAAAAARDATKRAMTAEKAALRAARGEANRTEAAAAVNPMLQPPTHVVSAVAAAVAAAMAAKERERAAKKEELAAAAAARDATKRAKAAEKAALRAAR